MRDPAVSGHDLAGTLAPLGRDRAEQVIEAAAAILRAHYGPRLHSIVLFGSRARGEEGPDSDADLVVVLEPGAWRFWDEKIVIVDLLTDLMVDSGLTVQVLPVGLDIWRESAGSPFASVLAVARAEGRVLSG